MSARIVDLAAWRRNHMRAQCDAMTQTEEAATQYVRLWSSVQRAWLRWIWGA